MTKLDADLGGAIGVNEIDKALPALRLLVVPQAKAAGRDAGIGRDASHFSKDQTGTAERTGAKMDHMEIIEQTIRRRVHCHGRDNDAVWQRRAAGRIRCEHGWQAALVLLDGKA